MRFKVMNKNTSQTDFWRDIIEVIDSIYSAALFDHWSTFTDKVAGITNSNKVSLSLINQKNETFLLYSSNTNHSLAINVNKKNF